MKFLEIRIQKFPELFIRIRPENSQKMSDPYAFLEIRNLLIIGDKMAFFDFFQYIVPKFCDILWLCVPNMKINSLIIQSRGLMIRRGIQLSSGILYNRSIALKI